MSHAGWGEIWREALTLLGAQPAHIRILAGLTVALCGVIFVEGLRACFVPRKATTPMPFPVPPVAKAKGESTQVYSKPEPRVPFRPHAAEAKPVNREKSARPVHRKQIKRPKIRRLPKQSRPAPLFSDEAAPFSRVPSAPRRV